MEGLILSLDVAPAVQTAKGLRVLPLLVTALLGLVGALIVGFVFFLKRRAKGGNHEPQE
jgi:hypothetical protein